MKETHNQKLIRLIAQGRHPQHFNPFDYSAIRMRGIEFTKSRSYWGFFKGSSWVRLSYSEFLFLASNTTKTIYV